MRWNSLLSAGEVVDKAGVSVQTLPYYERVQLPQSLERSVRNYRQYSFETVPRIKFIKKVQALGLTLTEIKTVPELDRGSEPLQRSDRSTARAQRG